MAPSDGLASPFDADRDGPVVTVYTTPWCGDCRATKAYLEARRVAYVEVDIQQDAHAAALVMAVNEGRRSVPTLVYQGNAASLSRFSPAKAAAFLARCGLLPDGPRTDPS